jgi:hypothetical protein
VLQIRHKHTLPTRALFVNLVKAFDTVDRELMFQILAKCGIPESMIYVIRHLYDDNKIKISVGSEKGSIKNTVSVKQGDAIAAVLFILVIQAIAETVTLLWTQAKIKTLQYQFHKDPPDSFDPPDPSSNVPHPSYMANCSIPAFQQMFQIMFEIIESAQNLNLSSDDESVDSADAKFNEILNDCSPESFTAWPPIVLPSNQAHCKSSLAVNKRKDITWQHLPNCP